MTGVTTLCTALLILASGSCAGPGPSGTRAGDHGGITTARSRSPTPPVFATAEPSGVHTEPTLRSVATGRLVTRLGRFGSDYTGNGLALAPDGRDVYFTLIPPRTQWSSLLLEQFAATGGRPTAIGHGEEPAVSSDGRLLAYTTDAPHAQGIVIRDIRAGVSRSIDVAGLLGPGGDLLIASVAWLSDDATVAVMPSAVARRVSAARVSAARVSAARVSAARVSADARGPVGLIVVHRGPSGLTARRIPLAGLTGDLVSIATDAGAPNTLLATSISRGDAQIQTIALTPSSATVHDLLTIHGALVSAFDPSGRLVLYLRGHSPPALWRARIAGRRLIDRRRLLPDAQLGGTAW